MKLPDAFSADVIAELARPVATFDPRNAELVPGVTPAWHVIETYAQREREVADELAARRFGIFVPEVEETIVRRGRKIDRKSLMFMGYIFVFVWLTDENYARVRAVDGVLRFVTVNDGKPAVISDKEIDILRYVENGKRAFPLIEIEQGEQVPPAGLSKRARRRWKPKPKFVDPVTDTIAVRPWSAFDDDLMVLDSKERNQTLLRALGLSS